MKMVYPVIFTKLPDGYMAYVPDMDINTQGDDFAEAIEMARDAIGIMGIDMEDEQKPLPLPSDPAVLSCGENEIISMVDIDFTAYRRANERRTVRRNVSVLCSNRKKAESSLHCYDHAITVVCWWQRT